MLLGNSLGDWKANRLRDYLLATITPILELDIGVVALVSAALPNLSSVFGGT